jgi:uncharacterized protein with GYD domain
MPKFMCNATYSSGSWARLMRISEDRAKAVNDLLGSLGGSLDSVYWEVSGSSVYALIDMPDSASAMAVATVMTHTGAFKSVEVHEVVNQQHFNEVLELADSVSDIYSPPGKALLDGQSSQARFAVRN